MFYHSIFLSKVTCSSIYSSQKIRERSMLTKDVNIVDTNLLLRKDHTTHETDEYPIDYSVENGISNSMKSHELKVQNQLLKDMGLQKFPDAKKVSPKFIDI